MDSDNKTSLEELTNWTQKSLRTAHQADAKARLKHLDTNKDNKVTWEEFLKSKEDIGGIIQGLLRFQNGGVGVFGSLIRLALDPIHQNHIGHLIRII